MRLRGSAERRKETGEEGEEARRGRAGAPELPRGAETEKAKEREMATGGITTLPASPDDGASGGFPPGNFKEPKRLYCKNGGYFLRINSDGRVDGIREKSDPHSECICSVLSMEKQERGDRPYKDSLCGTEMRIRPDDVSFPDSKCVFGYFQEGSRWSRTHRVQEF